MFWQGCVFCMSCTKHICCFVGSVWDWGFSLLRLPSSTVSDFGVRVGLICWPSRLNSVCCLGCFIIFLGCIFFFFQKKKQEAHGPQLAHLSETATADMQMACNIFPILLWQGNGLNSFWNILLTRLKCWNFQNVTSKTSHPQCLLPTFESTGISVQ